MQRLADLCTGPRVALLGVLAASYTVFLILYAETPMQTALQVAVELQKAKPKQAASDKCGAALRRAEGPLQSFDNRWRGYSKDEAATILCAMEGNGKAGKSLYLGWHFPYDMAFPFLYGPALAGLYLLLLASFARPAGWLRYFALVPILAAALDLAENLVVRSLVVAGPPPAPNTVQIASALTMGKCALVVASIVVVLSLLLWHLLLQSVARRPALE
jgi:hypothetical protein